MRTSDRVWFKRLGAACAGLLLWMGTGQAKNPEWLRALARQPAGEYSSHVTAVVLLDECIMTVGDRKGEMRSRYRMAYRILSRAGTGLGLIKISFTPETPISGLAAWSLQQDGDEYEAARKQAVDTTNFNDPGLSDLKIRILQIPGVEAGSVIGYEYEQKRRGRVLQDIWRFQGRLPVKVSRYTLNLPKRWEHRAVIWNFDDFEPASIGPNRYTWELRDLEAIEVEPGIPTVADRYATLGLSFIPPSKSFPGRVFTSWRDVSVWYSGLADPQAFSSPEIERKAQELTEGQTELIDKLRSLCRFAQKDVRYVAIELGQGAYRPRPAGEVLTNRYGDCKDKVTILRAMLRKVGLEAYLVLIRSGSRQSVVGEFPSPFHFNHVIAAIPLASPPVNWPTVELPGIGSAILFDPTDDLVPLGDLPWYLQGTKALLARGPEGVLFETPLRASAQNRQLIQVKARLTPEGNLSARAVELAWGQPGARERRVFRDRSVEEQQKILERFLSLSLPGAVLGSFGLHNLTEIEKPVQQAYSFYAPGYAQSVGDLLIFRPKILGLGHREAPRKFDRDYDIDLRFRSLHTEDYEVELPAGFEVDELPEPVEVDLPFAVYRSSTEVEGTRLRYRRVLEWRETRIARSDYSQWARLSSRMAEAERGTVVLKRTSTE